MMLMRHTVIERTGINFDVRNIPEFQDAVIRSARFNNMGDRQLKQYSPERYGINNVPHCDRTYRDEDVEWDFDARKEFQDILTQSNRVTTDQTYRDMSAMNIQMKS